MKRLFFIRRGPEDSRFIEDKITWIFLGRWTHLYNEHTKEWFRLTNRPDHYSALSRGPGSMHEIDEETFLRSFGWAGRRRLWWDWWGFTTPYWILRILRKFRKPPEFQGETEPFRLTEAKMFLGEEDDGAGDGRETSG